MERSLLRTSYGEFYFNMSDIEHIYAFFFAKSPRSEYIFWEVTPNVCNKSRIRYKGLLVHS